MKRIAYYLIILGFLTTTIFSFNLLSARASSHYNQAVLSAAVDENYYPIETVGTGSVSFLEEYSPYGNTNEIVATSDDDYQFSFYLENGVVRAISERFVFKTTRNHQFLAFFRPINKANILIVDANNKFLGSMLLESGNILAADDLDIFIERITPRAGYDFSGWNLDEDIQVEPKTYVFKAQYQVKLTTEFTVALRVEDKLVYSEIKQYGDLVTIEAPLVNDLQFSHFEINDEIVTFSSEYTFSVYSNVVIDAIYTQEQVKDSVVSYLYENTINNHSQVIFIGSNYVPKNYRVIEEGIIYLNSPILIDDEITLNDHHVVRLQAAKVSPHNEYAILKNTYSDHHLYYRAYVVVTNGDTITRYYSAQHQLSFIHEITYHLNGGSNHPNNINILSQYDSFTLQEPTREGFIFKGWFTDPQFKLDQVTIIESLETNLNLYAKWEVDPETEFSIDYNLNGGTFNYTKEDLKVDFLTDYYEFLKPETSLQRFMHSRGNIIDFRGKWAYKELNKEGWQIDWLYQSNQRQVEENPQYFINDAKYNYKWIDFFDMMEALVKETNPTQSFWNSPYTGKIRLYEYMTGEKYANKLELPSNLQTGDIHYYYSFGEDLTLPKPIRNNYVFLGWYDNPSFNGNKLTSIDGLYGDLTLYAKWKEIGAEESFVITFELGGGHLEVEKIYFTTSDLPITIPTPQRDGYLFKGWFIDEGLTTEFTEIDTEKLENIKLFAKWELVDEYTEFNIMYELNGGEFSDYFDTYRVVDLPLALPVPIKEHHNFVGWFFDSNFTGEGLLILDENTEGHLELYAKWEETKYNIHYVLDGGINHPQNPTHISLSSAPVNLLSPLKAEHKFVGWFTDPSFNVESEVTSLDELSEYTLYAKFTELPPQEYLITYHLNSGTNSANNPDTFNRNTLPINLEAAHRTGYKFKGWYLDSGFTGSPVTTINTLRNTEVYAKWEISTYNIQYIVNGGINHQENHTSFTINTLPLIIYPAYKHGYKFSGWYSNPSYNGEAITMINTLEEYTLYAKWEEASHDEYLISYNLNGGVNNPNNVDSFSETDLNITLYAPSRSGYVFLGWYRNSVFSGEAITVINYLANISLYAKWTPISDYTVYDLVIKAVNSRLEVDYNLAYSNVEALENSDFKTGLLNLLNSIDVIDNDIIIDDSTIVNKG